MKNAYLKVFGLLMACAVILGVAGPAAAFSVQSLTDIKTEGDFVVGPGKVELYLAPGESVKKEIMVTNRTGRKITFQLSVEDMKGSEDINEPVILLGKEKGPYSLRDFIKPEKDEFELENGQRAIVNVEIDIPADTDPGGRYGALIVSTKEEPAKKSTANIISRLGVLYYVRVKGDVLEKASFETFQVKGNKSMFSKGPIPLDMVIKNEGNIHLTPSGQIEIINMSGKKVGMIKVDPWFVLPNSLKLREVSWETQGLLFGKYTAIASINLGYGEDMVKKETTFWIIPWKLIITLFVIVILVLLIIQWLGKNFKLTRKKK